MDSADKSRQGSVVPTPGRVSLMRLAVLFLRLELTALVADNAGLLLSSCVTRLGWCSAEQ
jgi:hypothetical protein